MRLASPTDFDILDALSNGKRNTAANIAIDLGRDRPYINTRLPVLADHGHRTYRPVAEERPL